MLKFTIVHVTDVYVNAEKDAIRAARALHRSAAPVLVKGLGTQDSGLVVGKTTVQDDSGRVIMEEA